MIYRFLRNLMLLWVVLVTSTWTYVPTVSMDTVNPNIGAQNGSVAGAQFGWNYGHKITEDGITRESIRRSLERHRVGK